MPIKKPIHSYSHTRTQYTLYKCTYVLGWTNTRHTHTHNTHYTEYPVQLYMCSMKYSAGAAKPPSITQPMRVLFNKKKRRWQQQKGNIHWKWIFGNRFLKCFIQFPYHEFCRWNDSYILVVFIFGRNLAITSESYKGYIRILRMPLAHCTEQNISVAEKDEVFVRWTKEFVNIKQILFSV